MGGNSKLIPDQLFALDYGGSYRAFMLEVDRGTKPYTSPASRKSLKRSIDQYVRVIEGNLHREHYALKANVLVLWVFTSKARQQKFEDTLLLLKSSLVRRSFVTTGETRNWLVPQIIKDKLLKA